MPSCRSDLSWFEELLEARLPPEGDSIVCHCRRLTMSGGLVLDAGCGAGLTAGLLLGDMLHRLRYVGADISEAVDVAAQRFARVGHPGAFMQADLCALPLPEAAFDFILSEGVLHHTPSTRA